MSQGPWRTRRVLRAAWSKKVMRLCGMNWEVIDCYKTRIGLYVTTLRIFRGGNRG